MTVSFYFIYYVLCRSPIAYYIIISIKNNDSILGETKVKKSGGLILGVVKVNYKTKASKLVTSLVKPEL